MIRTATSRDTALVPVAPGRDDQRKWTEAERRLARRLARQERLARLLPAGHSLHAIEQELVAQALRAVAPADVARVIASLREILDDDPVGSGDPLGVDPTTSAESQPEPASPTSPVGSASMDEEVLAALTRAGRDGFLTVGPGGRGTAAEYLRWEPARERWEAARHHDGLAALEVDAISYPGFAVVSCVPPPGAPVPLAAATSMASLVQGRIDDSYGQVDLERHAWSTVQMDLEKAIELARALAECVTSR